MIVATAIVAVTVTVTLIYLIFYSSSLLAERVLNHIDWNFKLLAIYVLTYVFIDAELGLYPVKFATHFNDSVTLAMILMFLTASVYLLVLILV